MGNTLENITAPIAVITAHGMTIGTTIIIAVITKTIVTMEITGR